MQLKYKQLSILSEHQIFWLLYISSSATTDLRFGRWYSAQQHSLSCDIHSITSAVSFKWGLSTFWNFQKLLFHYVWKSAPLIAASRWVSLFCICTLFRSWLTSFCWVLLLKVSYPRWTNTKAAAMPTSNKRHTNVPLQFIWLHGYKKLAEHDAILDDLM